MANSKRRQDFTDRNGNMFMPMSVEGGTWNEHFFNTTKLVTMGLIVASIIVILFYLNGNGARTGSYILFCGVWFIASVLAIRFIIFEEKFYYKMYQELSQFEITSPAIFWDIASIKDTEDGAILTYSDAKIAIIVKLERDTVTGKHEEFKETHYDAISDFYRDIASNRYSFIQMNIMEQAGKDTRLNELSKIIYKSDNANIQKLMELQIGHIKNINHMNLYESDYFLFYTNDMTRINNIINDITESLFKILDGAYIGYSVLGSKDVVELVKEIYGVNYFNYTQAALQMFNRNSAAMASPFNVKGIKWISGEEQDLNSMEVSKLRYITDSIVNETTSSNDVSLKESIYRKEEKVKVGIDFSTLSESNRTNKSNQMPKNRVNSSENTVIIDEEIIDI